MIDGVAKLTREDYCDGLGDCLPACPTNAITFEMREAPAYDEAAVLASKQAAKQISNKSSVPTQLPCSCQGSQLSQWPVQIKLVPVNAPYFDNTNLLIAADCTAYAYANFHHEFIRDRITLIGCPKLDDFDYTEKLAQIIATKNIKNVTVVRMEVPCCGGIENATVNALKASGKSIPCNVVTVTIDGQLKQQDI